MAKFPVEIDDKEGIIDAVNNLLSGPSGLGQNFEGFTSPVLGFNDGVAVTGASGTGTVATLTFAPQNSPPFRVGQSVRVRTTVPVGYQGLYKITAATTSSISYLNTTTGNLTNSDGVIRSDPPQAIVGYMTSNFRTPYTNTNPLTKTYVPAIALKSAEFLNTNTIKFTYAETQVTPPFALGNNPTVYDSSNSWYNGSYGQAGIVQSTTEFCIVRVRDDGTVQTAGDGGFIFLDGFGGEAFVGTDANAKVQVNGVSDRVFLSGNMNNILDYTTFEASEFSVSFMINRYVGSPTEDLTNPGFSFEFDKTICIKTYDWATPVGTGTLPPAASAGSIQNGVQPLEPAFTAIIDQPGPGYYWYFIEIELVVVTGDTRITQATLFGRSLSAQVVKQ